MKTRYGDVVINGSHIPLLNKPSIQQAYVEDNRNAIKFSKHLDALKNGTCNNIYNSFNELLQFSKDSIFENSIYIPVIPIHEQLSLHDVLVRGMHSISPKNESCMKVTESGVLAYDSGINFKNFKITGRIRKNQDLFLSNTIISGIFEIIIPKTNFDFTFLLDSKSKIFLMPKWKLTTVNLKSNVQLDGGWKSLNPLINNIIKRENDIFFYFAYTLRKHVESYINKIFPWDLF